MTSRPSRSSLMTPSNPLVARLLGHLRGLFSGAAIAHSEKEIDHELFEPEGIHLRHLVLEFRGERTIESGKADSICSSAASPNRTRRLAPGGKLVRGLVLMFRLVFRVCQSLTQGARRATGAKMDRAGWPQRVRGFGSSACYASGDGCSRSVSPRMTTPSSVASRAVPVETFIAKATMKALEVAG